MLLVLIKSYRLPNIKLAKIVYISVAHACRGWFVPLYNPMCVYICSMRVSIYSYVYACTSVCVVALGVRVGAHSYFCMWKSVYKYICAVRAGAHSYVQVRTNVSSCMQTYIWVYNSGACVSGPTRMLTRAETCVMVCVLGVHSHIIIWSSSCIHTSCVRSSEYNQVSRWREPQKGKRHDSHLLFIKWPKRTKVRFYHVLYQL